LTEQLSEDFFSDPSYASVGCARTTSRRLKLLILSIHRAQEEEVFEESKSLLFKTLRVQRIYDEGQEGQSSMSVSIQDWIKMKIPIRVDSNRPFVLSI
jgi:catabolite regulation protein CreA